MFSELADENVVRIFQDGQRVEKGRCLLEGILRNTLPKGQVALIFLDLDGSIIVRKRGIEAKIYVVKQMIQLVRSYLAVEDVLIDSGTRDEMFVVLPNRQIDEALELAEKIRSHVQSCQFFLSPTSQENVHLTVSMGIVSAPKHAVTAFDLIWSAGQALQVAKQKTNSIYVLKNISFELFEYSLYPYQVEGLRSLSKHLGRTEESLLHEALLYLFERQKVLWYWTVEQWDLYQFCKEKWDEFQQGWSSITGMSAHQSLVATAWVTPIIGIHEGRAAYFVSDMQMLSYHEDICKLRTEAFLDLFIKQKEGEWCLICYELELPSSNNDLEDTTLLTLIDQTSKLLQEILPSGSFANWYGNSILFIILPTESQLNPLEKADRLKSLLETKIDLSASSLRERREINHSVKIKESVVRSFEANNTLDVIELGRNRLRNHTLQATPIMLTVQEKSVLLSEIEIQKIHTIASNRTRTTDSLLREAISLLIRKLSEEVC